MIELTLSKYLVKRIYSILLTLGAIIGVASLIIILSLFYNYYLSSEKVFMGIHPHIEIHKDMSLKDSQKIIQYIKQNIDDIINIQPALYVKMRAEISEVNRTKAFCIQQDEDMLCHTRTDGSGKLHTRYGFHVKKKQLTDLMVKGICLDNGNAVMDFQKLINGGTNLERIEQYKDTNNNPLPPGFYLEQGLFNALTGYFLINFKGLEKYKKQYWMNGSLDMGTKKGKYPLIIMSLASAQNALKKKNKVNTIEIRINQPYKADHLTKQIRDLLNDSSFIVENWIQKEKASFTFLTIIKWMIFAIIFSISIVAAISIFSTLYLTVLENRKKIAILKALGMKDISIYIIFLLKTLTIGFMGTALGCLLGYCGSHGFIYLFKESLEKLGLENPQPHLSSYDILLIAAFTIILFLLTAIIPARNAVKIDPIEGLNQ
ncbi:membrane protein containing DUF214, permase predicted [Candidatus Magnetomorum sp. HK-1]|nr:membrane protein containing DUF214, permase predicted [Candidatus Magnetomorum sp. HK-1]